jgi:hypothetical protein
MNESILREDQLAVKLLERVELTAIMKSSLPHIMRLQLVAITETKLTQSNDITASHEISAGRFTEVETSEDEEL